VFDLYTQAYGKPYDELPSHVRACALFEAATACSRHVDLDELRQYVGRGFKPKFVDRTWSVKDRSGLRGNLAARQAASLRARVEALVDSLGRPKRHFSEALRRVFAVCTNVIDDLLPRWRNRLGKTVDAGAVDWLYGIRDEISSLSRFLDRHFADKQRATWLEYVKSREKLE